MRLFLLVFGLLSLFAFQSSNPNIKVYEKEEKVEKLQRKGFAVLVFLEEPFVEKAWAKKAKEFGRVESSKNEYVVNQGVIADISPQPLRIYSKVIEKSKQGTEVWMAIDLGTEFITSEHPKYQKAERILYQFALDAYKSDLALQVEEAEKALARSTKEYERTVSAESRIQNRVVKNKERKKELLEELKQNKVDSLQLVKDIEINRLEQKQDSMEVVKMKKAVEIVKAKMTKME